MAENICLALAIVNARYRRAKRAKVNGESTDCRVGRRRERSWSSVVAREMSGKVVLAVLAVVAVNGQQQQQPQPLTNCQQRCAQFYLEFQQANIC